MLKRKASVLVRGTAEVFCVSEEGEVTRVLTKERFSTENRYPGVPYVFIPNHNIHNLPDQARGCLIVIRTIHGKYRLGVVVKLFREDLSCIVSLLKKGQTMNSLVKGYQTNVSSVSFGHFRLANMRVEYHRLLQQVGGIQLRQQPNRRRRILTYPFLGKDMMVSSNEEGPDIVPSISLGELPLDITYPPKISLFSVNLLEYTKCYPKQAV
jgi:hypothetical protein